MIFFGKLVETVMIVAALACGVYGIKYLEEKFQTGWFTVAIAAMFGLIYVVM